MEQRLSIALQRLGQVDRILRNQGRDPEPFQLVHAFGDSREILHPAWDKSWPTPTAQDIDDLEYLNFLRIRPATSRGTRLSELNSPQRHPTPVALALRQQASSGDLITRRTAVKSRPSSTNSARRLRPTCVAPRLRASLVAAWATRYRSSLSLGRVRVVPVPHRPGIIRKASSAGSIER